jgi:hypothetical protein
MLKARIELGARIRRKKEEEKEKTIKCKKQ